MRAKRLHVRPLHRFTGFVGVAWLVTASAWAQTPAGPHEPSVADPPAKFASSGGPPSNAAPASPATAALPSIADRLAGAARRDYEAGRSLYESGDFADARLKLQSAYDASPDPRLLWDVAACEASMLHYAKAVALVHRYLDSHSPLISPKAVDSARRFLEAAEQLTAPLDIESNQPDAMVYVDEEPRGTLPLDPGARVDKGTHRVTVKKRGFAESTTTLTVTSSAAVHVKAALTPLAPPPRRLVVHAGTRDVIAIDGVLVGTGAWAGVLPSGSHLLRVTAPESLAFESEVVLQDGETRTVDVALQPARHPAAVPTWAWIAGGTVLAGGIATAGYFLLRPSESQAGSAINGSLGTWRNP